ncbi:arginase family protein [Lysobacter enzymogenes]|uniref:arginase family protein n=1 Tax=Lysobacter enzymogenes TaxID=69 RepID=UPI00384AA650
MPPAAPDSMKSAAAAQTPVVLDLDASVGALPGALRLDLRDWHDRLRFACSQRALARFGERLEQTLPARHGCAFLGSGDFHHLSLPLIRRAARAHGRLQVVVFDNHPDNMRFPLAIHCGSWVAKVAALPQVARVHVVGITSTDIGLAHAWENRLRPLYRGKLRYWSSQVAVGWARRLGLGAAVRSHASVDAALDAFLAEIETGRDPIYLSIDKDVLRPEDAMTNWDQGLMRADALLAAVARLRSRIVASDITGEISIAAYPQWWKRALAAADGQSPPDADALRLWQAQQHRINLRLLSALG